jgi:hypothetical protein
MSERTALARRDPDALRRVDRRLDDARLAAQVRLFLHNARQVAELATFMRPRLRRLGREVTTPVLDGATTLGIDLEREIAPLLRQAGIAAP